MNQDATKSIVLNLEALKIEYNTVLLQYNQVQTDYMQFLKSQSLDPTKPMADIKGQAYWGSQPLGAETVSTIDECKTMCSNDSKCTGATYNPDKKYCWTRSGDGKPIPALDNDYAIIPESVKYLNTLQALNQRLTDINTNIQSAIEQGKPVYDEQLNESDKQIIILKNQFQMLNNERNNIDEKMKTFNDLNETQKQTGITTNQHYYYYIFICSFTVIVFIILLKVLMPAPSEAPDSGGGSSSVVLYFIIFICLALFLVIFNSTK